MRYSYTYAYYKLQGQNVPTGMWRGSGAQSGAPLRMFCLLHHWISKGWKTYSKEDWSFTGWLKCHKWTFFATFLQRYRWNLKWLTHSALNSELSHTYFSLHLRLHARIIAIPRSSDYPGAPGSFSTTSAIFASSPALLEPLGIYSLKECSFPFHKQPLDKHRKWWGEG